MPRQMLVMVVVAISIFVAGSPSVIAQQPGLILQATDDQGRPGGLATIRVLHSSTYSTQGWSFGLCHDPDVAAISGVDEGTTTATINQGGLPDFQQLDFYADGWTSGVVFSFLGLASLQPGRAYELYVADYLLVGADGDATDLDFCTTLGFPPVSVVFPAGGASLIPIQRSGFLEIVDSPWEFRAPTLALTYPGAGSVDFTARLSASQVGAPVDLTEGFSISLAYDTTRLDAVSVVSAGPVAALNGGAGPDFFSIQEYPEGIAGGVTYSTLGSVELPFADGVDLVAINFETEIPDLLGDTFLLHWADGIGVPFWVNGVDVAGQSEPVVLRDGLVRFEFSDVPVTSFLRADCDRNGAVAIGDAVELLQHLFQGLPVLCREACDADASGALDIADPLFALGFLFSGGSPPTAPFPVCAASPIALDCEEYPCP